MNDYKKILKNLCLILLFAFCNASDIPTIDDIINYYSKKVPELNQEQIDNQSLRIKEMKTSDPKGYAEYQQQIEAINMYNNTQLGMEYMLGGKTSFKIITGNSLKKKNLKKSVSKDLYSDLKLFKIMNRMHRGSDYSIKGLKMILLANEQYVLIYKDGATNSSSGNGWDMNDYGKMTNLISYFDKWKSEEWTKLVSRGRGHYLSGSYTGIETSLTGRTLIDFYAYDTYCSVFYDINDFLSASYKNEPKEFNVKRIDAKNQYEELLSTFSEYLNDKNKEFFKPYKKSKFVKTGEDYNTDTYDMYRSANVDPLLAMSFSKVSTGYNKEIEVMRTATVSHSQKIEPSWDEIKNHFGGLKGLMDKGIKKETPIYLSYNIDRIEFSYEPKTERVVAVLYITMNTSSFGKEYYAELLKNGNKIKLVGEAKLKENPFDKKLDKTLWDGKDIESNTVKSIMSKTNAMSQALTKLKSNRMLFECEFPDNPTKKTNFTIPLSAISDNKSYKDNFNDLYKLFFDELESMIDDIPHTKFERKNNLVLVNFLVP